MSVYLCVFFFLSNNVFIGVLFLPLFHTDRSSAPVWLFVCLCLCLCLSVCLAFFLVSLLSSCLFLWLFSFSFQSVSVCLSVRPPARPPVPLSRCLDVYLCNMSISLSVKQTYFCVHFRRRPLVIVVVVIVAVVDFALWQEITNKAFRICTKDKAGDNSQHDPVHVDYLVLGGK